MRTGHRLKVSSTTPTSESARSGLAQPDPIGPIHSSWAAAGIVLLVIVSLGPVVAYLLPQNPFAIWPWTKGFTDFAAAWIPAIDQLTGRSQIPQVTRLFMSFEWFVCAPIFTGLLLRFGGRYSEQSVIASTRLAQARWWYSLLGPPVMASLVWFLLTMPTFLLTTPTHQSPTDDPFNMVISAMSGSRFWLGFIGSMMVLMAVASVLALALSFKFIRVAYAVRASSPLYKKDSK